jgi:hypothetical protein
MKVHFTVFLQPIDYAQLRSNAPGAESVAQRLRTVAMESADMIDPALLNVAPCEAVYQRNRDVGGGHRQNVYSLAVEVEIKDLLSFIRETRGRYQENFFSNEWGPATAHEAAYEYLFASNSKISPSEMGYQLLGFEADKAEAQDDKFSLAMESGCYKSGNCDVMALALHRLTGFPMGLWGGRYKEDGEDHLEFAHACVLLEGEGEWADADGSHSDDEKPDVSFSHAVDHVGLRYATEMDVRTAFTTEDIPEEQIGLAMARVEAHQDGWLEGLRFKERQAQDRHTAGANARRLR